MSRNRVVIVGGGLSGLAAGARLAKNGIRVTLLEKRPFLGGRAYSFNDPESGVEIDNGQHVFLGACDQYLEFLRLIGARDNVKITSRLKFYVKLNGITGKIDAPHWAPGIVSNLIGILRFKHLSVSSKLRIIYGLTCIKFIKRIPREQLDQENFESWLRKHRQNNETIARFWNLIVLPALNDNIAEVSADAGIMLFQTALLGKPHRAAIGLPTVGLSKLAGESAKQYIESRSGVVKTGINISEIVIENDTVKGILTSDKKFITTNKLIIALTSNQLLSILPEILRHHRFFQPAKQLTTAPIVGVHFWYDRQIMSEQFLAILDSPLQWIFNITKIHNSGSALKKNGQHIAISLSGAWYWKDLPKPEIRKIFENEIKKNFPRAKNAKITRFRVVKMLNATFRSIPGSYKSRLPQITPITGLYLAGDWTKTDWPSTMESAIRGGNMAVDAMLNNEKYQA